MLFLYKEVLEIELPWLDGITRARPSEHVPVVFTVEEVNKVLTQMTPPYLMIAQLQYGAGLRLMEVMRLRIKDVDFGYQTINVRNGKGGKDRVTVLPKSLADTLRHQINTALDILRWTPLAGQLVGEVKELFSV